MKKNGIILLTIAFNCILLFGCDEKEVHLSKMCNCMEKKQQSNSNAAKELFGNNITTVMANADALDCAQQIQNEDNLSYSEMVGLFQEFTRSSCGKQYGIDDASLDEATKNLKQEINNSTNNPNEGNNSIQGKSSENTSVDTSNVPPLSMDTLPVKSNE